MSFELSKDVLEYLEKSKQETIDLIEELCKIPAPSHHEEKRAEFVKKWLENVGAEGVYIDEAKNCVFPLNCEGRDDITIFNAHTDTVFPDLEPMPFVNDGKYLYSPGVGDDTANLAKLMMVIKYIIQNNIKPKRGILFVANSCEEGLGNLKGIKQIMNDYPGRIKRMYAIDLNYTKVYNKCVGSHRYEIVFETEGGHSFNAFGNKNALHAMSELITSLYKCKVPEKAGATTTYNVGMAEGGTSVNTIAQSAKMMYEYRSDSKECLAIMQKFFEDEIEKAKKDPEVKITVNVLGMRPCRGDIDEKALEEMTKKAVSVCEKYSGIECKEASGSTDCNIPMSLGVPAVCFGTQIGEGAHTREEKLLIESIPAGLKIAAHMILSECESDE